MAKTRATTVGKPLPAPTHTADRYTQLFKNSDKYFYGKTNINAS